MRINKLEEEISDRIFKVGCIAKLSIFFESLSFIDLGVQIGYTFITNLEVEFQGWVVLIQIVHELIQWSSVFGPNNYDVVYESFE